jgi:transcriptional regulator with XRE-family HTH domain
MAKNARTDFQAIVAVLRQMLKSRGKTYADLAKALAVSEQTIKRLFNGGDAAVSRLVEVCEVLGVSFFEVVRLVETPPEKTFELTAEQEEFFAAYPGHFSFFNAIRDGTQPAELRKRHGLSAASVHRYLRDLDRLGLIELHTQDRFKLLPRGELRVRRNGKLSEQLGRELYGALCEFFLRPEGKGELSVSTASEMFATRETVRELKQEVNELASRYRKRMRREFELLPKSDLVSVTMLLNVAAPFELHRSRRIPEF